jgi:hypothetical protein
VKKVPNVDAMKPAAALAAAGGHPVSPAASRRPER